MKTTMPPFAFTIQGVVHPKARPRTVLQGGIARTYTPSRTKDSESDIRACILLKLGRKRPDLTGRFAVEMCFVGQRGDLDNLAKTILDAGTGLLWENDSQVDSLRCTKASGATSWVEVTVRRMPGLTEEATP